MFCLNIIPVAGLKVEKMMPYFMNLWSVPLAHFFLSVHPRDSCVNLKK